MLRRAFCAVALLLILTARANASPINLLLTVDHYAPIVGPPEISLHFSFFESATNGWPGAIPPPALATGGGTLLPGVTQFTVSLDSASLDNIYFSAYGFYASPQGGPGFQSIFVGEPPTGHVSDGLAFAYGPPWIPLKDLGDGMTSDFYYIFGYFNGPIGTWALTEPVSASPVPEPATLLLFGTGLAAAARKYLLSKSA